MGKRKKANVVGVGEKKKETRTRTMSVVARTHRGNESSGLTQHGVHERHPIGDNQFVSGGLAVAAGNGFQGQDLQHGLQVRRVVAFMHLHDGVGGQVEGHFGGSRDTGMVYLKSNGAKTKDKQKTQETGGEQ